MSVDEEITMRILLTDREFLEALKTIPKIPEHFSSISFVANGIEKKGDYKNQCLHQGIMPDTQLFFKYDRKKESFLISNSFDSFSYKDDALNSIMRGGKIHTVYFNGWLYGKNSFDQFIRAAIKLKDEKYVLNKARISINMRHLSGYNEGYDPDTELSYEDNLIELNQGSRMDKEELEKIKSWMNDLRK